MLRPNWISASPPCSPNEWLCKGGDVERPDVECCWEKCLPMPIDPPYECPTNTDGGQKDGTGKTGADRRYFYYDFDLGKIVEVPPVVVPGSSTQTSLTSQYAGAVQGTSSVSTQVSFVERVWQGVAGLFSKLYLLVARFA